MPTDLAPGLEHLVFTCNTPLFIYDAMFDFVRGAQLSNLRSLMLDFTHHGPDDTIAIARWMYWLVRNHQHGDGWNEFQGMHLVEHKLACVGDHVEPVYRIFIPRDDIVAWCESNGVSIPSIRIMYRDFLLIVFPLVFPASE